MKQTEFIQQLEHKKIVAAIREAEKKTSGEIRVFVSRKKITDAVGSAQAEFNRLGMTKTERRNGVLIFVAPASQKFAVIGDTGVHEKCGQAFWEALAAEDVVLRGIEAALDVAVLVARAVDVDFECSPRRAFVYNRAELPVGRVGFVLKKDRIGECRQRE